jgi:hypothetical protein
MPSAPGTRQVVRDGLERGIVRPVEGREIGAREGRGAERIVADDRGPIHAQDQGAPDADVVQRGALHVEIDGRVRRRVRELLHDAGIARERIVRRHRDLERELHLVGAQLRDRGVVLGDVEQRERFNVRHAAEVIRVRGQDDPVAAKPAREFIRTGPDRRAVERYAVDIRILRKKMLGQNVIRRVALAEERIDGRRKHSFHVKDDRIVVRNVDGGNLVVAALRANVVALVHDGLPGELDVLAGEGHAVVPLYAVA